MIMNDNLIKKIEFLPINIPANNWSQNTCIVKVTDEAGRYGIGEADGDPDVVAAFANAQPQHKWWQKLADVLIGRDPIEFDANWDLMYEATRWIGMRGFGLFVISGIDMALYDLAGKQHNVPAYKLMGGAFRDKVTPYFTLYPDCPTDADPDTALAAYKPLFEKAKEKKVKAVKVCLMQDAVMTKEQVVYYLRECRKMLGDDIDMMIDPLYRWTDWEEVKWILNKLEDIDLYFAEATLPHDDMEGHRKLSQAVKTRICGMEMGAGRFEAEQWLKYSGVSIIQPDYNRCGGLTELRRISHMAEQYNVQVSPHHWKTGITAAAARHFHINNKYTKYVEYLHPDFYDGSLRKYLTTNEAPIVDGYLEKPTLPGLGIDINREFYKEVTGKDFDD